MARTTFRVFRHAAGTGAARAAYLDLTGSEGTEGSRGGTMSNQTGDRGMIADAAGSGLRSTGVRVERRPAADRDPMKVVVADHGYDSKVTALEPDEAFAPGRRLASGPAQRLATARSYLMCPPAYFTVTYSINPWMRPDQPTDTDRAMRQWEQLRQVYLGLGHTVQIIDPVPGLPDMVFAANGATVIDGTVLGVKFRFPEREAEAAAYLDWFCASGYRDVRPARLINEGEGDILFTGRALVAAYGFRTDRAAHAELEETFGVPVISVRLVDPRFYHLDTAMCVLDDGTAAYYPEAFEEAGRAALAAHFPELIEASAADAEVFGLNAVSDGRHVVLPVQATELAARLAARGFEPIGVDLSELRKSGGGPKCCSLELRAKA
jgi:N-dimethylarginine dimethylaminohydrolase